LGPVPEGIAVFPVGLIVCDEIAVGFNLIAILTPKIYNDSISNNLYLNDAIAAKYCIVGEVTSKSKASKDIGNNSLNIILVFGLFVESKIVKVPSEYAKTSRLFCLFLINGKEEGLKLTKFLNWL
jgi:hypothetical protein